MAWTGKESRFNFNSFGALYSKPVRTSEFLMSWLPMAIGGKIGVGWRNKIVRNSSFSHCGVCVSIINVEMKISDLTKLMTSSK